MEEDMEINKDTLLKDILKEYPWLADEAVKIDERLSVIKTPLGKMLLRKARISDLAEKAGFSPEDVIAKITEMISEHEEEKTAL